MSHQLRMLLAIGLSLGIFYAWYAWIAPPPRETPQITAPAEQKETNGAMPTTPVARLAKEGLSDETADPQANVAEKITVVRTDHLEVELTSVGGVPRAWRLLPYQQEDTASPVDLVTTAGEPPLLLTGEALRDRLPHKAHYRVEQPDPLTVVFSWRGPVTVTKTYRFHPGGYLVDLEVAVLNEGDRPIEGHIALGWSAFNPPPRHTGWLAFLHGPPNNWGAVYYKEGSVARRAVGGSALKEETVGRIAWGGIESRYYLAAVLPRGQGAEARVEIEGAPGPQPQANTVGAAMAGAPLAIAPGQRGVETFSIYGGPKQMEALKAVGVSLDRAIDYGWFGFAAIPILYLLKFFYSVVRNYGIAIILLTIFIKLLLHPITKASLRSMRKMQTLQPRLKELREKYKGDSQRLNQETMLLFRSHGVNPMGGCLPMVLQIPVYIALYKVLWNAIELYQAPFVWFYKDLSAPDPYFVAPVVLGVAFYLQQKLTPSPTMDPTQRKMMTVMPVMFTAFMVFLPSGLVIYILVNTLFSVLQQWLMNRGLGFRDLLRGRLAPRPV